MKDLIEAYEAMKLEKNPGGSWPLWNLSTLDKAIEVAKQHAAKPSAEVAIATPSAIIKDFFERSARILDDAINEVHQKHPKLFPAKPEAQPAGANEKAAIYMMSDDIGRKADKAMIAAIERIEKARPGEVFPPLWWSAVFSNAIRPYLRRPTLTPEQREELISKMTIELDSHSHWRDSYKRAEGLLIVAEKRLLGKG